MEHGEVILYQQDELIKLEVRLEDETVWLTQAQTADLFGTRRQAITKHLKNIFENHELEENSVCSILELTAADGKKYKTKFYNLDAILSVGYRVNSKNATLFRQFANKVLKEYFLKGYSINQRIEQLESKMDKKLTTHDRQLEELANKVDFFVRTSLPPVEGVFFDGQIFDAYIFATSIIKSARTSIVLIDNYVDESVLLLLSKRATGVEATIYTKHNTSQLQSDLIKHNSQYPTIDIKAYKQAHDRFIVIDNTELYHIGASLKDLGKKLFAFSKMEISASVVLNLL